MRTLALLLLFYLPLHVMGQGCSDAGFCTMGAMKPDQAYSNKAGLKLRSIGLTYYQGTSLLTPVIQSFTIDVNVGINDLSAFQVKVPYQWSDGNLGRIAGIGDLSLSYTRTLKTTYKWNVNGSLGAKIPSGDGNRTVNNEHTGFEDSPVHMYYQNSLGSYDAIAGVSAISKKWLVATGIQIALTRNDNQFTWEEGNNGFPNYPSKYYMMDHNVGRELKRGIDVMLRVERNWRFAKFNFTAGALPIYRITQDEGIGVGETERKKLDGTTGVALSVLVGVGYKVNVNHALQLIIGRKILDRDFNPDGLTRNEVVNVTYVHKF